MNLQKVTEALAAKFTASLAPAAKRRIVFWYDEAGEFQMDLESIVPDGVKVLRLNRNYFDVKHTLERKDPLSDYLVYCSNPKPPYQENWLLDIEMYSDSFSADMVSLILDDFKIENLRLRDTIKQNIGFFESKDRLKALHALNMEFKTDEDLHLGMLAVVCRTKVPDFEMVLRSVLLESIEQEENKVYEQIRKYPGEDAFWAMVKDRFGYSPASPTLKDFFISCLLTATFSEIRIACPVQFKQFLLPKGNSVHVFLDHWQHHSGDSARYDELSKAVFDELELKKQMERWRAEDCLEADTFDFFDKIVIKEIVEGLLTGQEEFEKWQSWINQRKTTHWYREFEHCYSALEAAIGLFQFKKEYEGRLDKPKPDEMMKFYAQELYRADQLYRHFFRNMEQVSFDVLHRLADELDNLYVNWFQETLNHAWSDMVDRDLEEKWQIAGVSQQRDFYHYNVRTIIERNEREKAFVIVSDGLRYEAAQELVALLESETRSLPTLEFMQGSLPSYTDLGMASLLPAKSMAFADDGKILADGMPVQGSENRERALQTVHKGSMVINLKDLMTMSKEDAREAIKDNRVIYIYHNTIDNIADKQATEHKTFEAVEDAIREIKDCVKKIIYSLNGTHVIVTADHGFLFQRQGLPESDKISSEGMKGVACGRRFILTDSAEDLSGTIRVSMKYLLGKDSNLGVYVPRGNIRFKCSGGMKYVHGGASLQEIVVPVLKFTNIRKESKRAQEVKKVDVELTSTSRKIPNNPFVLNFFQTEKTGPKSLPRTLRIALCDFSGGQEKVVSTEELLKADRDSENAQERTFSIRFKLKVGVPNGEYHLRLTDDETKMPYQTIPFEVKLGIPTFDDFGS